MIQLIYTYIIHYPRQQKDNKNIIFYKFFLFFLYSFNILSNLGVENSAHV